MLLWLALDSAEECISDFDSYLPSFIKSGSKSSPESGQIISLEVCIREEVYSFSPQRLLQDADERATTPGRLDPPGVDPARRSIFLLTSTALTGCR
jgi:hypothetical protein